MSVRIGARKTPGIFVVEATDSSSPSAVKTETTGRDAIVDTVFFCGGRGEGEQTGGGRKCDARGARRVPCAIFEVIPQRRGV